MKIKPTPLNKEWLYVGHYFDIYHNYILKIGTTKNLKRRQAEHNANYKKSREYTMPKDGEFVYDWAIPLSKYNTLRFEDLNREEWKKIGVGTYVRNDRFNCGKDKPEAVTIKIKSTYEIKL